MKKFNNWLRMRESGILPAGNSFTGTSGGMGNEDAQGTGQPMDPQAILQDTKLANTLKRKVGWLIEEMQKLTMNKEKAGQLLVIILQQIMQETSMTASGLRTAANDVIKQQQ